MGLGETAELAIRMNLTGNAKAGIKGIQSDLGKLGRSARQTVATTAGNIARVGAVAFTAVGVGVKAGLNSLAELESAVTSVDGAIKQMGLTGKLTGQEVAGWANEIEAAVGAAFDDKAITQAATTLIRYGKVSEQNLKPALVVMTDLAAKTGDVEGAATLLAKALADPAKAAGKLARQGVILTKAEQKQIDALVEAGDVVGAQTVLLDALTKSTKGAAAASQGPYQRSLSILKDVTEDAERALATGFLPVIEEVRDILSKELAKQSTLDNIKKFGETLAGGLRSLIGIARNLPWEQIGDSLKVAGAGAKAVLDAFAGLPPWIQTAVITGWGLNKLTGGALTGALGSGIEVAFKGVFGQFFARGASPANPMWVASVGGGVPGGGAPGVAGAAGGLLGPGLGITTLGIGAIIAAYQLPILMRNGTQRPALQNQTVSLDSRTVDMFSGLMPGFTALADKFGGAAPLDVKVIGGPRRQEEQPTKARETDRKLLDTNLALHRIRERAETIGANIRTATREGDSAIVAAIERNRPVINVRVSSSGRVSTTYKSGGTVTSTKSSILERMAYE